MGQNGSAGTRVCAIVGPYLSGKTSLLESILHVTGKIGRKGTAATGFSVGDTSDEAKSRTMTVEMNIAETDYLDDPWVFLDCPGSVEFQQDTFNALMVADVAVVVCDPEPERAMMVQPVLKFLDERAIPHMIFINKVDHQGVRIRTELENLQAYSERPLILREVPIRDGGEITGYVDLVSEKAYRYKPGEGSELMQIPASVKDREEAERQELLEHLADFDDHLLEELLEDVTPPNAEVYTDLAKELADDLIVPVFFGAAEKDEGVRRLLKALRHEAPTVEETAVRLGLDFGGANAAQVFKTAYAAHAGKLSIGRVWSGAIKDGTAVGIEKISGLYAMHGGETEKIAERGLGAVIAMGKLDRVKTGDAVVDDQAQTVESWPAALPPLFAMALTPQKAGDDIKLTEAVTQMCEEDPSLSMDHDADTNQLLLWGQGDIHLSVAVDRLASRFHVTVDAAPPQVPYKETVRKSVSQQGRHKRQTGGHGQFADVHVTIKPQGRGVGFAFSESVVGGVVPRNYIPAVEKGVVEALKSGPLGFPVVDVAVELTDGSHHAVDSSDQAFQTAGQIAIREGLPKCEPVLLEPIVWVEASIPNVFTSKAQRALSSRRGQILGFNTKDGWDGWDVVQAFVPQAEMHDLIIELRSTTKGVGTFAWRFDRLQELTGRQADDVVKARKAALER